MSIEKRRLGNAKTRKQEAKNLIIVLSDNVLPYVRAPRKSDEAQTGKASAYNHPRKFQRKTEYLGQNVQRH